jgi:hypothetical protein
MSSRNFTAHPHPPEVKPPELPDDRSFASVVKVNNIETFIP